MNKLKTFIFYDEYLDALNTLSDEKAGRMIKRICKFIYTDEPLEKLSEADEKCGIRAYVPQRLKTPFRYF